MNPFANDDEPAPAASYHPDLPQWLRMGLWYGRNPAHNLTHYMIGLGSKSFTVTRSRPDSDNDGFAHGGGFFRCTLRCEDGTSRPYISHQSARGSLCRLAPSLRRARRPLHDQEKIMAPAVRLSHDYRARGMRHSGFI